MAIKRQVVWSASNFHTMVSSSRIRSARLSLRSARVSSTCVTGAPWTTSSINQNHTRKCESEANLIHAVHLILLPKSLVKSHLHNQRNDRDNKIRRYIIIFVWILFLSIFTHTTTHTDTHARTYGFGQEMGCADTKVWWTLPGHTLLNWLRRNGLQCYVRAKIQLLRAERWQSRRAHNGRARERIDTKQTRGDVHWTRWLPFWYDLRHTSRDKLRIHFVSLMASHVDYESQPESDAHSKLIASSSNSLPRLSQRAQKSKYRFREICDALVFPFRAFIIAIAQIEIRLFTGKSNEATHKTQRDTRPKSVWPMIEGKCQFPWKTSEIFQFRSNTFGHMKRKPLWTE